MPAALSWMTCLPGRSVLALVRGKVSVNGSWERAPKTLRWASSPDGVERTYPNLLTREAVMGTEHLKWSARVTPEYDCTLPFTRMLAGPLDYCPGGFLNATREGFEAREMRPMWADWVLPRLDARGTGRDQEVRTLRLTGIGESQVADRLGESLLRAPNPTVATYARSDAVDVRIAARPDGGNGSGRPRSAADIADAAEAAVIAAVGEYVWARGDTTWRAAIGERLDELGWRAAAVETGLGGELTALFGDADWLERTESRLKAATT